MRNLGYDVPGTVGNCSISGNRIPTFQIVQTRYKDVVCNRNTRLDVYIYCKTLSAHEKTSPNPTHWVFFGSCFFNASSTRISILLASLYFGIALMIFIATLRRVSICLASTTLPKVPCPNNRTILSSNQLPNMSLDLHFPLITSSGLTI